ncbi:MAG: response regulator [Oscillochloris sp.]|nr:response regulator [Oscillochloris sp.]
MTSESPLTILVVDDDAVDRRSVRRAFHTLGESPAIEEAVDSHEAYEKLKTQSFDCVLLDYRLPDADGLAIVRELRRRGLQTPIIVLTGQGDEQIAVELMKAGATDYITKTNLGPEHLSHSVRNAIRIQRAEMRAAYALQDNLERLKFLADVGEELSSSLDIQTLVERLNHLLTPRLADWCAIDVLEVDGGFRRSVAIHPDADPAWLQRLEQGWPLDPDLAPSVAMIVHHRTNLVFPLPNRDFAIGEGELRERLREEDVSALICLPILSAERVYGGLTLIRRAPGKPFTLSEIALIRQIAERAGAALENARLYQMARDAVKLRDDFLSIASHELRTPLTSMLGYIQLLERVLRRKHELSEREERALRTITAQTKRLNTLITAMLDVSRLQDGQLSIDREVLDLRPIVERSVAEFQPTLNSHQMVLAKPDEPVLVLGDEVRLQQVLLNLLSNAVKYSPQGGTVAVRVEQNPGWATIAISDEGIGIPRESLDRLFSRFFRASNANERRISGIGLGLYVVNAIVTLHGGTISVDSQIGCGSTFTIRLPLATEVG